MTLTAMVEANLESERTETNARAAHQQLESAWLGSELTTEATTMNQLRPLSMKARWVKNDCVKRAVIPGCQRYERQRTVEEWEQ
jgi:hypothetical protein